MCQVDDEVDENEHEREDEHDALHERKVALRDCRHGELAETRPTEDRFGEDCATEKRAEANAGNAEDRQDRIGQVMRGGDAQSRESSRAPMTYSSWRVDNIDARTRRLMTAA